MGKKIRVWDGSAWQDVSVALPYNAVHSAQASMPSTAVDGQIWLDTDGTLSDTQYIPKTLTSTTGDIIYASSANTPARLGIGTSGQVLSVSGGAPTWAAPAGMSWTQVLARTSVGTGTSYTATGLSGYNQLMIYVAGLSNNGTTGKYTVTFNGDTGSQYFFTGGGFASGLPTAVGSGQRFFQGATATTSIDLCDVAPSANLDMAGGIHILGANTTGTKVGFLNSAMEHTANTTTSLYGRQLHFRYNGTSVISSVTITATAGNFDDGFITIFGSVN